MSTDTFWGHTLQFKGGRNRDIFKYSDCHEIRDLFLVVIKIERQRLE
jgi:hypothetical protein